VLAKGTAMSHIGLVMNTNTDTAPAPFASHIDILEQIREIVRCEIKESQEHMHGREILDDIIDDLTRYRSQLPTIAAYEVAYKL